MKKQFVLFALVILIIVSASCSAMQPIQKTYVFDSEERVFEWIHSSELEEAMSTHIEKDFAQEAIKILRETPILVPYYHNEKILPTYNNERMMPQKVSVTIPVNKNTSTFSYNMECKTEQGQFVFEYSYFRDEQSKDAAKQSENIYAYQEQFNSTKGRGSLYLIIPINGETTLCTYRELKEGIFKKVYKATFLMGDLYIISVQAESKDKLVTILSGLSFQEITMNTQTE